MCSLHAFKWMHYLITSCIPKFSLELINYLIRCKKEKAKREKAKAIADFREWLERKGSWSGKSIGLVARDDRNHTAEAINTSKIEEVGWCQGKGVGVLSPAGMKLIFFIAGRRGLCSGFVTITVLVTHRCFVYCWAVLAQHKGFLFSRSTPAVSRLGAGKNSQPKLTTGTLPAVYHAQQEKLRAKGLGWGSLRLDGHQDYLWEVKSDCFCITSVFSFLLLILL